MRKYLFGLLSFLLIYASPALAAEPLPRFEPAPCPASLPNRQVACGFLLVPEDRNQSNSPTIKIAVAVLKAGDPNPQPDPILIVNGGPGSEALSDLPRFVNTFGFLTSDPKRDVIIFDQRGVGLSQPALGCPELRPLALQQARGVQIEAQGLRAAYESCRDHWLAQGVNLAAYSTAASAADINDLWRTLGYTQVNLYGVSYGTVLAQTVARDHPEGIRSVVLDSAYPLSLNLLADSAANLHEALNRIFANCVADWPCHWAYPDLPTVYEQTLQRLQSEPAHLSFHSTTSNAIYTYSFGAADFVDLLRTNLPHGVPALVYAVHDGDYTSVLAQLRAGLENTERYGPPANRALVYSVMCSQALYQVTPQQMADTTYPEVTWAKRFVQRDLFPLPCDQWPHAQLDPKDSQVWVSDIPTLILQGANDNTLTTRYNDLLAATFRHGTVVSVPDVGHGVLTASLCANTLARAYFSDPGSPLNSACLNQPGLKLDFKYTLRGDIMALPIQLASGLLGLGIGWALIASFPVIQSKRFSHSILHSLKRLGWVLPLTASALAIIGMAGGLRFIGLDPVYTLAVVLVPITALQATFIFSPEDEPALEVTLATPRPLAWTLIERWGVLVATYSGFGFVLSLGAAAITGEALPEVAGRWLPTLIVLSALSACLSLILRRALTSLSLVGLVWFAAFFLGGYMVQLWPLAWPIHLYIEPGQAYFWLNRIWLVLAGLGLMAYACQRLVRDEERLLLGQRRSTRRNVGAFTTDEPESRSHTDVNPRPLAIHQVLGIIRYEVILQIRRPGLAIFGLCLLIIPIINAVIGSSALSGLAASVAAGVTPASYAQTLVTNQILPITWLGGLLASLIVIFIVVADTIPKDKQLGVFETLQSLPMRPSTYLLGKVLSVWVAVGLVVAGSALLTSLVNWLRFGAFNLSLYFEMWLAGIGSLTLINSALGVLLSTTQPNNRRAVLVGIGLAVVTLALMTVGVLAIQSGWSHFLLSRPALTLYYLTGYPGAAIGPTGNSGLSQALGSLTSQTAALWDIAAGFGEVIALGIVMTWRLGRKAFG